MMLTLTKVIQIHISSLHCVCVQLKSLRGKLLMPVYLCHQPAVMTPQPRLNIFNLA